jgi:Ca2+-transporting ATPase
MKNQSNIWHHLKIEEVFEQLQTKDQGLTSADAASRLERHGLNELPQAEKTPAWKRFLSQFNNVLIYILIAASFITAWMDDWLDTGVIWAVILVNALIGFVQEGKAADALESLKKMLLLEAEVQRDGKRKKIAARYLVPGDIVFIKAGDKIPADMRLLATSSLKVEEAPLTGESVPAEKHVGILEAETLVADRSNMVHAGCSVTYGTGKAIVTGTGMQTEIGHINKMLGDVVQLTTPLLRQIAGFGKLLSIAIVLVAAAVFAVGHWVYQYPLVELFPAIIGLIVASIPEGLPALMTITLALGVQEMARKNAIICKLPSVETLGAVGVVCSDKTGTLTKNEMTVKTIVTHKKHFSTTGTGYAPKGILKYRDEEIELDNWPNLKRLLDVFGICNDASIREEDGQWLVIGQPTEGALITLVQKAGLDLGQVAREASLPFDSEHKFMAVQVTLDGQQMWLVKGAPEKLLEISNRQLMVDGSFGPLDQGYWNDTIEVLATEGMRVIAAAMLPELPEQQDEINPEAVNDLVFIGLAGMIDPPRDEVYAAVQACQEAGIAVKMITGDHALTAETIGKQLGISGDAVALTGQEIERLSDAELVEKAQQHHIFARTTPEHKLRLVNAYQAKGHVVAMTGDGVNDAPALKRADVGVAMGIKGTEVTRDAADMVLTDDNFTSIVNAIRQGRTTFANLKKAILFILPTNGAEAFVIITALLIGSTLPITAAQILWVNMITAVTLGLALAFEPGEPVAMKRPPRDPGAAILDSYLVWRIVFVSVIIGFGVLWFYRILREGGATSEYARTVAVNALVVSEAFYLINCRYIHYPVLTKGFFDNSKIFIALGLLTVFQILFTYAPIFQTLFQTDGIGLQHWGWIFGLGLAVFFAVELEKLITNLLFSKKTRY